MSNKRSFNDLQFTGPKLQTDLPRLITRWRSHKYVYCADIEKEYRQIWIHEDDRRLQCIRWRYTPADSIQSYYLCTVTYGTPSAPFLAQRVLKQLLLDEGREFPLADPILRDCFYVDDCLFGSHDITTAKKIRDELIFLLKRGGFPLRKWVSNCPDLLVDLDSTNHGLALDRPLEAGDSLKVLGFAWSPQDDCYRLTVCCPPLECITKRVVLSTIAKLYDPLGWFSPVVILAKGFMQRLWKQKLDWDEVLPDNLKSLWVDLYHSLPDMNGLTIPRWTHQGPLAMACELIGFADASTKAYGAVVYLQVVLATSEIRTSLLLSKTRVAPVKEVTIPRLELNAAVLLACSINSLQPLPEYASLPVYCWSDSSIVLAWLSRQSSAWKPFVANRVAEIHAHLPEVHWRHVSGMENPTDLASRGVSPATLVTSSRWFDGPEWLLQSSDTWPTQPPSIPSYADMEARVTLTVTVTNAVPLIF